MHSTAQESVSRSSDCAPPCRCSEPCAIGGIYVRSLREGVDTSTPTGRAVTSIMATIAELELELGKERRAAPREAW